MSNRGVNASYVLSNFQLLLIFGEGGQSHYQVYPSTGGAVKSLVRWAAGKRLTNRLPKLSFITLSPPLNSGIHGLRMGPHVPTPKFFTISGHPERVIYQILDLKFTFFKKRFHGGREIRTHDQRPMVCRRRHSLRHYSVGLLVKG